MLRHADPGVRSTLLTVLDALLLQRLTAEGVPVQTARQAFVQWLANNGLTVYSL